MRANRSRVSHADTRTCSRSPSSPTAGKSPRTRPSTSAASTAGPGRARRDTGAGAIESPGMARIVVPGADIDRVIQRVITRSAASGAGGMGRERVLGRGNPESVSPGVQRTAEFFLRRGARQV